MIRLIICLLNIYLLSACDVINKLTMNMIETDDYSGSAFILNRSGNDILIYVTNHRGVLLKNGCDDVIVLTSEYFKDEKLYIEECTEQKFLERRCVGGIVKEIPNISDMISAINRYKKENDSHAAYLLDKNYSIHLTPYNEKPKYKLNEGFIITCR